MVAIVDIIIGVIMLIFLIMGLSRGFIKTVLALLGTLVALVLAYFLARPFLDFVNNIVDVTTPLNNTFVGWIEGWNPDLLGTPIDSATIHSKLVEFATSISLPETFYTPIVDAICNYVNTNPTVWQGQTVASVIAPFFTNAILLTCSTLVLFVLIRIALYLIEKIMDWTLLKIHVIRVLDRLLGLLFGAVQGLLIILLCFTLISFLATNPESALRQAVNDSTVGKVIYEANPLPSIITQNLNIEQIIKNIFNPDEDEEEEPDAESQPDDTAGQISGDTSDNHDAERTEGNTTDRDAERTEGNTTDRDADQAQEDTADNETEQTTEDPPETESIRFVPQIVPGTAPLLF